VQQQINQMMAGVDRQSLVKAVAIGLVIYAVLNGCLGLLSGLGGGLMAMVGAGTTVVGSQTTGVDSLDAQLREAQTAAVGATGFLLVISVLYLISVPLFAVTAYGLFQRKSWSRRLAIVSLGLIVLLSIISFHGILDLLWLVVAAFILYMFITDEGIKQVLSA
jgi:hypothetical protein